MTSNHPSPVPFNDLLRGTQALRPELDAAIARVLSSGWYVLGPEHQALESELGAYVGAEAVLVGNGTDALQLALSSLGVVAGDTVLTAANAGGYTSVATRALGALPAYADVDPATHLLGVETLERALRACATRPKVVVVTHLYGAAAPMPELMEWARHHGLLVVEDCAQSLGASVGGRKVGAFGHAATTSFYPTKNLGALGDGGAIFSGDPAVVRRARQLRQYGWESKYRANVPGGRNSRLDELQAAVLRVKLPHLDAWNERRRAIHAQYEAAVRPGSGLRFVNTGGASFVAHLAVVEVQDREGTRAAFEAAGIRTEIHYPVPDHRQPLLEGTAVPSLPTTEALAGRVLSLPLFPELTPAEVERVARAIAGLSDA